MRALIVDGSHEEIAAAHEPGANTPPCTRADIVRRNVEEVNGDPLSSIPSHALVVPSILCKGPVTRRATTGSKRSQIGFQARDVARAGHPAALDVPGARKSHTFISRTGHLRPDLHTLRGGLLGDTLPTKIVRARRLSRFLSGRRILSSAARPSTLTDRSEPGRTWRAGCSEWLCCRLNTFDHALRSTSKHSSSDCADLDVQIRKGPPELAISLGTSYERPDCLDKVFVLRVCRVEHEPDFLL